MAKIISQRKVYWLKRITVHMYLQRLYCFSPSDFRNLSSKFYTTSYQAMRFVQPIFIFLLVI
jgi:hypothetical protein